MRGQTAHLGISPFSGSGWENADVQPCEISAPRICDSLILSGRFRCTCVMPGSGSQKLLIPLSLRLCFSHGANLSLILNVTPRGFEDVSLSLSRATTWERDWWNDFEELLFPNKWGEPRRKGGYKRKRCRERTQSYDFPCWPFWSQIFEVRCLEEQQVNLSQVGMETVAKTFDFC